MKVEKYPNNYSNASITVEELLPLPQLVMRKYEDAFDFYSEEPSTVSIKREVDGAEKVLSCIMRIRIWKIKKECCSWSIYADDRSDLGEIVIRKVVWDMDSDQKYIKENIKNERGKLLNRLPTITTFNKNIYADNLTMSIEYIKNLDKTIENGILLYDAKEPEWEWRDIELLRLFDWGQIHITWSPTKENKPVEKKIKELISKLEYALKNEKREISSMQLNYNIHPRNYEDNYKQGCWR